MTSIITPAMQRALIGPRRNLCWLFWFEGNVDSGGDLYAWTGDHKITWDGHEYFGVGRFASMSTQTKPDALQHVEHTFVLSALDPEPLAELDDSVRGKGGKVYLAALNERRQIIADPLLLTEIVQDTIRFDRGADDTVTLTLTGYEALPFLGRAKGDKYSHDKWVKERDDTGFYMTSLIAASGPAVSWIP